MTRPDPVEASSARSSEHPGAATHLAYFGLGSNLGERDRNVQAALDALAGVVRLTAVSSVYDTAPLLVTDQPRFHNAVCAGHTSLAPLDLLHRIKSMEQTLGRVEGVRFGPRVIDIDLLFYDQLVIETPELTLPHPRLAERAFVLAPLAEIAPDLLHPVFHVTISALAATVLSGADIRSLGHLLLLPD
ncbi:MAG TPA: 2-amino-4-hydroxy-6-hydroxymethyldihydropteridine diphosphokinase [Ktedonobacterales bacterium]